MDINIEKRYIKIKSTQINWTKEIWEKYIRASPLRIKCHEHEVSV